MRDKRSTPDAEVRRELGERPVVVEPRHRGEPLGRHVGRMGRRDEGVGVRGIADHEHPDVVGGVVVDGSSLRPEDATVRREQVGALHACRTRSRPDQKRDVGALEGRSRVIDDVDALQQGERRVRELHGGALGRDDRQGHLEQPKLHRLVAQHRPGGDAKEEGISDLTGRTGHRDDHASTLRVR